MKPFLSKNCRQIIPGTFIVCGEGQSFCSEECYVFWTMTNIRDQFICKSCKGTGRSGIIVDGISKIGQFGGGVRELPCYECGGAISWITNKKIHPRSWLMRFYMKHINLLTQLF